MTRPGNAGIRARPQLTLAEVDARLTARGAEAEITTMDSLHRYDDFVSDMLRWRSAGELQFRQTLHSGLASAPEALCSLFGHAASGKVLVVLGETAA